MRRTGRRVNKRSNCWRGPRQLRGDDAQLSVDDLRAAGDRALRLHAVDDCALARIASQEDTGDSQVVHHLEDLLVGRARRAAHTTSDDHVQTDVSRLR